MMGDGLSDALRDKVMMHLEHGEWRVVSIAGGRAVPDHVLGMLGLDDLKDAVVIVAQKVRER